MISVGSSMRTAHTFAFSTEETSESIPVTVVPRKYRCSIESVASFPPGMIFVPLSAHRSLDG
jgi:hypothetical protein